MTDEELKIAKERINGLFCDRVIDRGFKNSLFALITEEQQKRATRMENVNRAILRMDSRLFVINENKKALKMYGVGAHLEEDIAECNQVIKDYDLAITALEQMNTWSCAYCGETVRQKEDIDYHVRNCAKHPIAEYRHRIAELEQEKQVN